MTEPILFALGCIAGHYATFLAFKGRLDQLKRLTDRDARGRFVKREI